MHHARGQGRTRTGADNIKEADFFVPLDFGAPVQHVFGEVAARPHTASWSSTVFWQ
ncbi:MAG TPA: hypothetical protein VF600_18910 [Abditibacteriaceae bacterium]